MRLTLTRLYKGDDCTIGVLSSSEGLLCFTLENPWKHNEPCISCIPEGEYTCKPHNGTKYKDTWEVRDVEGRSAILFHSGNTESDTKGCILPGEVVGSLSGERAVLGSRLALGKLRGYIGFNKSFILKVKEI